MRSILINNKVKLLDKRVRNEFGKFISVIGTIFSFGLIFFEIPSEYKVCASVLFGISMVIVYFSIWRYANRQTSVELKINGSSIQIKTGNIFDQDGFKVIPFNEFFDTQVDDRIINRLSLNGQFIENYVDDIEELNERIRLDSDLNDSCNIIETDVTRGGNKIRYQFGSIFVPGEFLLSALSRFSKKNEAYLNIHEYVNFLIYFWDEINRVYAQKSVSVPIFGSGITRFKNGFESIDENELLSIMIWTFKISKMKFAYPAKLSIIVHEDKIDKINVFSLKEEED
jgi:hypothetical protein